MDYEFHAASEIFPLLKGREFGGLVANMREHGFDPAHPILLFEGKIIDGRNRYRAAQAARVEPIYASWNSEDWGDGDPFEFAWQENGNRRHLDPGTKASCRIEMCSKSIAWKIEQMQIQAAANASRSAAAKKQHLISKPRLGEPIFGRVSRDTRPEEKSAISHEASIDRTNREPNRMRQREAKAAGVSEATMGRALSLHGARPDLHRRVVENKITLNEALRLKRRDEVNARLAKLPRDKFRVIYADPPWDYGDKRAEIGEGLSYGPAAGHYPSMPMAELMALDINGIAAENAVLFLWAPSPLLPEALALMKGWGFDYKSSFVWDKVRHNFGHYNSVRHEFLLLGTCGRCLPEKDTLDDSVIEIERTKKHSGKPAYFRELIDSLYPSGARIELFARGDLPEPWCRWGAEASAA